LPLRLAKIGGSKLLSDVNLTQVAIFNVVTLLFATDDTDFTNLLKNPGPSVTSYPKGKFVAKKWN
jgi:hypothetical protein